MAVQRIARGLDDRAGGADRLRVEGLIERYGYQWLATARRSSPTAADAEDAYQRALETLLTNPPAETDPERIAAWMNTVTRNEALQIVRSGRREVDAEFEDIADGLASELAQPEETILDAESHGVAKEALRRLRPDQTRCLLLRADGFDYPEICRLTGFSYAKVNRLISEGRKAARLRVVAISAGRECERIEPLLSIFLDGEASFAVQQDVQLHLENCARCQATMRDYATSTRDLAALFPVGAALDQGKSGIFADAIDRIQGAVANAYERVFGHAVATQGTEVYTAKKIATASAIIAAIAGGGIVAEQATDDDSSPSRPQVSAPGTEGVSRLFDPIAASESRVNERRRRAARRARSATSGDVLSVEGVRPAEPSTDGAVPTADQEVAADPNDAAPQGAPADTGTDVGGLTP